MDIVFSMFNHHINDALYKAKVDFVDFYDALVWQDKIQPFIDNGVMSIFDQEPTPEARVFVCLVYEYVNEGLRLQAN